MAIIDKLIQKKFLSTQGLSDWEKQQYQLLLTRYLQERLLYRLSISPYRKHFLLKGGALLYAHERLNARPTLDIDFMGASISNNREYIRSVMKEVSEIAYE